MPLPAFLAWIPIFTGVLAISTLIACLVVSQSLHHDTGGLTLPYISDTGRDPPEHYIFAVGLTISGLGLAITAVLNFLTVNSREISNIHIKRCASATIAVGALGGIFLALLSNLDDKDYPNVHLYCAILFFVCALVFVSLNLPIYYFIWKENKSKTSKKSFLWKLVLGILFYIFFIIYIPIGLAIVCSWDQDPETHLYNYRGCIPIHHTRTSTQYGSVISFLLFVCSLTVDFLDSSGNNSVFKSAP